MNLNDIKNELLKELPPKTSAARILDFLIIGFRDLCVDTFSFTEDVTFLSVVGQREYTLTPTTANVNVNAILRGDIGSMSAPIVTLSTAVSGGTLAASTYYYRVSATDTAGETLASLEKSVITTGSTSTVTLTWVAIAGATGYKVYGRSTGAELLMATYSSGAWDVGTGTSITWVDDGSVTPSGALPSGNIFLKPLEIVNPGMNQMISNNWTSGYDDSPCLSGTRSFSYNGSNVVQLNRVSMTAAVPFRFKVSIYPNESFAFTASLNAIFEQYRETLKHYCMWKINLTPKMFAEWADINTAMMYRNLYENEKSMLKMSVIYEHGGASRVYPNNSFGG